MCDLLNEGVSALEVSMDFRDKFYFSSHSFCQTVGRFSFFPVISSYLVHYSLKGTEPCSFSINPAIVCQWQILSTELVGDYLKGPKHGIFEHGLFTQIRLVRVSDLGTKPKNSKNMVGALYFNFVLHNFLAMIASTAKKNFKLL
jgi:hypothetical protein